MRPEEFGESVFTTRKSVILLMHENADADALGACIALRSLIPDASICRPGSLDRGASSLADRLDVSFVSPPFSDDTYLIAVDTSTPSHLSPPGAWNVSAVLDHHFDSSSWKCPVKFIDERYFSSCEMVVDVIKAREGKIDASTGLALLAGIIADTASLRFSDESTLERLLWVIRSSGSSIAQAKDILEERLKDDMSKRISRLKAAQRLRYISEGDVIMAASEVSAYEALAAKALVDLGADIAFVASQRKSEYRISARARRDIVSAGIHTGRLLIDVASEVGGEAGGHDGAGGLEGVGDAEHVLNVCLANAKAEVRKIQKGKPGTQ